MNSVEAFKNELKNYYYYIDKSKNLNEVLKKLDNCDDSMDRYKMLKPFSNKLVECERELDGIFTQLTGFHAIRYDKEPTAPNEHLSQMLKLELIEKYNDQLKKFEELLLVAENNLLFEINTTLAKISHIESILNQLPKEIKAICVDIYCKGKKYEDVSNGNNVYWSASGVYWNVNKELEKVLN